MREILFRGLAIASEEEILQIYPIGSTVEGFLIHDKDNYLIYDGNVSQEVSPETIGQYTGLTDKNGVKIFEGDIYNHGDKNITYKVIFKDGQFIGNQMGNRSLAGLSYWREDIEVVGNIHQTENK